MKKFLSLEAAIGREPDNEFYAKRKTSESRARVKEGGRARENVQEEINEKECACGNAPFRRGGGVRLFQRRRNRSVCAGGKQPLSYGRRDGCQRVGRIL